MIAIDFVEPVFTDASNEPMLIIVEKSDSESAQLCSALSKATAEALAEVRCHAVPADLLNELPGEPFLVRNVTWIRPLLQRLGIDIDRAGEHIRATQGLRTGDNAEFIAYTKINDEWRSLVAGSDIGRYEIYWPGTFVLYDRAKLDAPRDEIFWQAREKLIVQEIRNVHLPDRLVLGYDSGKFIALNTTNAVILKPTSQLSLKFIAALFLSRFLNEFCRSCFVDNHIATQYLEALPIPKVRFDTDDILRGQFGNEARALYQCSLSIGAVPLLDFVVEQLAAQPERTDVIHDLLAFLAERMIELNKAKQAEVQRFLGWLEDRLRIQPKKGVGGIDSLTGKTIIQGYLGDYQKGQGETVWADFYYRLHRNRNRFGVELEEVRGEIQTEYEHSLARLLPIKSQLAHTDNLIDQIVYKLYGLTDEEIELIERPAYDQALADAKAAVVKDEKLQADPDAAAGVMAEAVLPAARRLQGQLPLAAERASLDSALPGWHLFPEEVATFLLSGEYDLHTRPDGLDFSSAVVSFSKAVERMLYHRIFLLWRDAAGAVEADARNRFLQEFLRKERELTLGSLAIILQSSKETALRAYIQQRYPHAASAFFGVDGVVATLNDPASIALRNAAAHDELLGREAAQSARVWALGILRHL